MNQTQTAPRPISPAKYQGSSLTTASQRERRKTPTRLEESISDLAQAEDEHDPVPARPCSEVKVAPEFKRRRPIDCWVADYTNLPTAIGIADAATVISVFAWETIGWRVSIAMTTSSVIDTGGNKILALR